MKNILLIGLVASLWAGCTAASRTSPTDCAVLIDISLGKSLLEISNRRWAGIWEREGFQGCRNYTYWAALDGNGPVFRNPHFREFSPEIQSVGTITLDREHNRVAVNMRRLQPKPGKPDRTEPSPANGTFIIHSIRKANRGESWF
jgi:hypothetical protein